MSRFTLLIPLLLSLSIRATAQYQYPDYYYAKNNKNSAIDAMSTGG